MFKRPIPRFIRLRSAAFVLTGCLGGALSHASTLYWDSNGATPGAGSSVGVWGVSSFWSSDPSGTSPTSAFVPGSDVVFSAGTNGTSMAVSVSSIQVANSIAFDDSVTVTLSGGTAISLGGAIGEGIYVMPGIAAPISISTPLRLNATAFAPLLQNAGTGLLTLPSITGIATTGNVHNITLSSQASGGITVSGIISDGTGGGKVGITVKNTGSGATILSGANTFTGGVNLNSGVLRVGATTTLGAASNVVNINGGTILGGAAVTIPQPMSIGAKGATFSTPDLTGKLILGGALTGSGAFIREGRAVSQFDRLGNANSWTVQITAPNNGFTGSVVLNGGYTQVAGLSLGNGSAPGNHITVNNGAELITNSSALGLKIFANHGAIFSGADFGTKEFAGAVTANHTFNVRMGDYYQAANRSLSFTGAITGSGAFALISAPTVNPNGQLLTFSGDNSGYDARMRASAGYSLLFTRAASIPTGGVEVLSNGAQLGAVGFAYNFGASVPVFINTRPAGQTTGGVFGINTTLPAATTLDMATLGGGGMFLGSVNNSGTYSATTLGADNGVYRLGGGGGTLTFTGAHALSGANDLVAHDPRVNGGGTIVLAAPTSFSGTTTVQGGTLRINFGASTAPVSNIIVPTSPLVLKGGGLALTGSAGGPSTQTFASTTLAGHATTSFTASGANLLVLEHGTFIRGTGTAVSLTGITATAPYGTGAMATTTSTNDARGILGSWAFIGIGQSTRYATRKDDLVAGQILGAAGTTVADASLLTDTTGMENYNLSAATGTTPASVSANTIRYTGTTGTTVPGATLFQVNGLLNTSGNIWTIDSGKITIGSDRELVINAASNNITISSIIADNPLGASSVTITSVSNAMTLSGVNTFTGGLYLTGDNSLGGTVNFPHPSSLGANGRPVTLNGGRLNFTGNSGTVSFAHPLVIGPNGGTLSTPPSGDMTIAGGLLTGSGTFTRSYGPFGGTPNSILHFTGANPSFTGQFDVNGLTRMSAVNALGTGVINVGIGGELIIDLGVEMANPLILSGGTLSGRNATAGSMITIPASTTITASSDFRFAVNTFQTSAQVFGFHLAASISGLGGIAEIMPGSSLTNNRQTILLSGNNSAWSGNINMKGATASNGYTLRIGSPTALGDSSGVTTIAPNSLLDLNGITLSNAEPLFIGGSGPAVFPTALTNENATPALFSGPITLTANTIMGSAGGGHFTLSGSIGGAFGLAKNHDPSQILTLGGNNTFTGDVNIRAGGLTITNSHALGTGVKTVTIIPNGNPTDAPSLRLDGSTGSITLPPSIGFTASYDAMSVGLPIADAGAVINVAGNNAILGDFSIPAGGGGLTFLSNAGVLNIGGSIFPTATGLKVNLRGNGNGVLSGQILDGSTVGMPVSKDAGNGTWIIAHPNNSYTGLTTVSTGTLLVTGAITGSTTVGVDGTFGGTGTTGSVNINAGGTLAPGVEIGTLTTGALTFNPAAAFDVDFHSTFAQFDRVNVSGNLSIDLGGNVTLNFNDLGGNAPLAIHSVFTLIDYSGSWNGGTFSGRADDSTFTLGANTFRISYDGTGSESAITLTVVPEPSTTTALLGGLALVASARRRR